MRLEGPGATLTVNDNDQRVNLLLLLLNMLCSIDAIKAAARQNAEAQSRLSRHLTICAARKLSFHEPTAAMCASLTHVRPCKEAALEHLCLNEMLPASMEDALLCRN